MNVKALLLATATVATLAALGARDAHAATDRIQYIAASAVCQAVDPSNFTGLRFRSVGIYNASNANIQVACSIPTEYVGDQDTGEMAIVVHNFRASPGDIKCTVHAGNRYQGTNSYPGTITVPANSTNWRYYYNLDKNNPGNYTHYNLTCIIPQKFELSTIRWQERDTGDGL